MLDPKRRIFLFTLFILSSSSIPIPPSQKCDSPGFHQFHALYHIYDTTCASNDPTGLVYDPANNIFHIFYQKHLESGVVYGHVITSDLVHYERVPSSIVNGPDEYDATFIYSGSGTLVNDTIFQIYPGICTASNSTSSTCGPGGVTIDSAFVFPLLDPKGENYTKSPSNPLLKTTIDGRDPSSAWQVADGSWRLVLADATLLASSDFVSWEVRGKLSGAVEGECPSFFALDEERWVYKHSGRASSDILVVGSYDTETEIFERLFEQTVDRGFGIGYGYDGAQQDGPGTSYYASKDMVDGEGRRIILGWVPAANAGILSLPREVEYEEETGRLAIRPVKELVNLRKEVVKEASDWGVLSKGQGHSFEVRATFSLGDSGEDAVFGVVVGGGIYFYVHIMGDGNVYAGEVELPLVKNESDHLFSLEDFALQDDEGVMKNSCYNNYDDFRSITTPPTDKNAKNCAVACSSDPQCITWMFSPGNENANTSSICGLKSRFPSIVTTSSYRSVGIVRERVKSLPYAVVRTNITDREGAFEYLPISESDGNKIEIAVFVDNVVAEGFFNSRIGITKTKMLEGVDDEVSLFKTRGGDDVQVVKATLWSMLGEDEVWV